MQTPRYNPALSDIYMYRTPNPTDFIFTWFYIMNFLIRSSTKVGFNKSVIVMIQTKHNNSPCSFNGFMDTCWSKPELNTGMIDLLISSFSLYVMSEGTPTQILGYAFKDRT